MRYLVGYLESLAVVHDTTVSSYSSVRVHLLFALLSFTVLVMFRTK